MTSIGSPSPFLFGGKKAYSVDRSLRFSRADTTYVERTPSSNGNKRTWTFSAWIKRGQLTSLQTFFSAGTNNPDVIVKFTPSDQFEVSRYGGSYQTQVTSTQKFRDPSAWYHLVAAVDTTQATASNRVKMYVNGTQITDFANSNYPSQNYEYPEINNTSYSNKIGKHGSNSQNFDGYMTEINFLDGYAYDPSYFGETDAITGQWVPKKYVGSYGTNGFYLNFSDNSGTSATTLGKDSSGNGNNFTPFNFAVSDALKDTPTLNFCTMNSAAKSSNVTLSEGNLGFSCAATNKGASSTFGVSSGKWYWEVRSTDSINGGSSIIGIVDNTFTNENFFASNSDGYGYAATALKYNNSSNSSYGATWTNGDIIGVALDLNAGTLTFYKNNSSQGVAYSSISGTFSPVFSGQNGTTYVVNFGQDSTFAGAISSGGNTDANGKGDFKYAPPSGHLALCSANLPDPTILDPSKHFDTLLWTGTSASHTLTGLNFQPDWFWAKSRSQAYHNTLMDSVRGADRQLWSNRSTAEQTDANFLTSFNSNGLTLGDNSSGTGATNTNGHTYVGWNWNAGDTDGKTYTVTVVSDSGNKYRFDGFGTSAVTLDLAEGGTYTFDGSDSSMSGHPFVIGTAANGSVYSTGVTYQLDGASVTYSAYTSGYSSATTRKLIITVPASAPQLYYWCSIHSGMGGAINTNTTLGSSNFDGTLQATVKANATAGFSIVTWTGNQTSGATLGHELGVAPKTAIVKRRDGSSNWIVPFFDLQTAGKLNATDTLTNSYYSPFFTSLPSSTLLTIGSNDDINRNSSTYVAYCFSEVAGYSKFGSYKGNGNANGTFIYTGFRPAWIMLKRSDSGNNWHIADNKRQYPFNVVTAQIYPNLANAEVAQDDLDILSNGFKIRRSANFHNANGGTYIYFAFAESPFKNARAR